MTRRTLIEPARLAGAALLHTQSDERLVDLARAGNDRAFEAIVSRYRRPLLRHCGRLLSAERAEDAVQQTFLNAYRAIGAGEAELNLRPWLYRIAHNAALSILRQSRASLEQLDENLDGVEQPPQALERSERLRDAIGAVQALPERQREAVVLRELEGRSYEEIAAALDVSGGAVRQLLNRARTSLRAAATVVTPWELAAWSASRGGPASPVAERIAELSAEAGGLAGLAKLGTAVVVAGAVVGGGTGAGPLPGVLDQRTPRTGAEQAVAAESPSGGPGGRAAAGGGGSGHAGDGLDDGRRGRDGDRDGDDRGPSSRSGPGGGDSDDDGGGDHGGEDRSGSDSGSGSSGSGSGSGSSGSGSDTSGSGSGDSGSGSSDSGTSGSGGSGDSDSSGSGSGSSGSGTSGSGSGTIGSDSGSIGSGTSGSDSGTSGSGSGSSRSVSDSESSGSGS